MREETEWLQRTVSAMLVERAKLKDGFDEGTGTVFVRVAMQAWAKLEQERLRPLPEGELQVLMAAFDKMAMERQVIFIRILEDRVRANKRQAEQRNKDT